MFYRPCPDTLPPADTDIDDPAMAEAAAILELGEQDLRMLARLAEIAMRLAEKLGAYAEARLTAATIEGAAPLAPREDPAAAFNKMAQTVRRILALRARIAAGVETTRADLTGKRAQRREKLHEDHCDATVSIIDGSVREALAQDRPDLDKEAVERLLGDMSEFLCDATEFDDINRPIGETIARLCKILGLEPGYCIPDGDGWKIRRAPYVFEKPDFPSPSP